MGICEREVLTLVRNPDFVDTLNLKELERFAVKRALVHSEGNLDQAARLLGISKATMYRKVESLGMKKVKSVAYVG